MSTTLGLVKELAKNATETTEERTSTFNAKEIKLIKSFIDFTDLLVSWDIVVSEFVDKIHSNPPEAHVVFTHEKFHDKVKRAVRHDLTTFYFSGETCKRRYEMVKKVFSGTNLDPLSLSSLYASMNPFCSDELRQAEVADFINKKYYE